MSPKNQKRVQERVAEAARSLSSKLPETPNHPKGRNSYAHIWKTIRDILGESYKDLDDSLVDDVMEIIRYCEENPF